MYSAFGEIVSRTGTTENAFTYTGEQWDPNAGFYYLRARWYNPEDGRFVSVDPHGGDPQSPITLHRFLFANANPAYYTDPSGKFAALGALMAIMDVLAAYVIVQGTMELAASAIYGGGNRPDSDRRLTFLEAALWWKRGNGQPLTVDLDKIDMGISASDFNSVGQSKEFNFLSRKYYFSYNTAVVYGRLDLTLTSVNTIVVTSGGDMYDFDFPDPLNPDLIVRNFGTAVSGTLHGPGKPFWINIVGTKTISP